MSTTVKQKATVPEQATFPEPDRITLYDIPWSLYIALRSADDRRGVRMSYLDGTLELMSPEYIHDKMGFRLGHLIMAVAAELDIPCAAAGSTTLKRRRKGKKKGAGKEPDTSFYVANAERVLDKEKIDLKVDPPPDLAIEVDNTTDSEEKLPIYAALRVPEVWRFDARTNELWFGKLQADGTYAELGRSVSLPMLTPALVLEGLALCQGRLESRWDRMLREWVKERLT